jgi:Uma2 family endonuclease
MNPALTVKCPIILARRGSSLSDGFQREENHIAPQVVFEILSHSNRQSERKEQLDFYNRYGVEGLEIMG